jgi:CubicO group peptidase (beta-lactamase class C family)
VIAGGATLSALSANAQPIKRALEDSAITDGVAKALNAHACPGVSVALARAGTVIGAQGFGVANLETQTAVSPRSIFHIGSLTKQFTAAAIIKLAALGKLDVRAEAASYLPAFKPLKPFTLLELMNHTAGLYSDEGGDPGSICALPAKTQIQLAEDIARQSKPFDFEPGTAWLYSNANYVALGAIIESIMGVPLDRAMAELIFKPLALTSLAIDQPADVVAGRASGYSLLQNQASPFENAAYLDVSQAGGAGAMRGNATDLCLWHDALLSYRLFDRAHVNLMLTPGRLRNGRLSGTNRFSAEDAHYGDVEYACGLLISGPSEENANILHYGVINGFAAVLQTYTKKRVTFSVLCNADIGPALPFREVRKAVVSRYLA